MGVKINDLVKSVKKSISMESLTGKKIAIDAFNTLYQFLAIIRQYDGTPLKNDKGDVTSHLSGIFYRTINFVEHEIKPIFVFDGKPSKLKLETIKERQEVKSKAKQKMIEAQDAGDFREARKFAQLTSKLTTEMIEDSKTLINYLGIPIVQAPSEGEAQSAYLVESGDAWGCASQDYDTLLFGGLRLIRNFAVSRSKKVKDTKITLDIEYISLPKLLEDLEITREQLIEMGILIGVDFFPGIKGIGQHTALELIKKYGSIKTMLDHKEELGKRDFEIDPSVVEQIKGLFLNPNVTNEYPKLKWNKIDYAKVKEFLVEKHSFSRPRVEKALERLKKMDTNSVQTSLNGFFKKNG